MIELSIYFSTIKRNLVMQLCSLPYYFHQHYFHFAWSDGHFRSSSLPGFISFFCPDNDLPKESFIILCFALFPRTFMSFHTTLNHYLCIFICLRCVWLHTILYWLLTDQRVYLIHVVYALEMCLLSCPNISWNVPSDIYVYTRVLNNTQKLLEIYRLTMRLVCYTIWNP